MSVLIAIGFDEAPVVVAAYDVGLQAGMIRIYNSFVWLSREIAIGCGAVSNRYNTGISKGMPSATARAPHASDSYIPMAMHRSRNRTTCPP